MAQTEKQSIKKTISISTIEGIFAQTYMSFALPGSVFITKFALMLNATPLQLGLLSSVGTFASIFQLLGIIVSKRVTSIKNTIIKLSFIGRGMILLIGLFPFIFGYDYAITIMLILSFISVSIHSLTSNMWVEWIAGSIPQRIRGRFFSIRQQYIIIAGLFVSFLFSIIIDSFQKRTVLTRLISQIKGLDRLFTPENLPYVFLFMFTLAIVSGFTSLFLLKYQPERERKDTQAVSLSFFKESFKDKNFRILIIFSCWWMASIGIGAPFWQPFMINKLNMSLYHIQIYGLVSSISSIMFLRFWGRLIDKYGNKTIMFYLIILGSINPLIWLFINKDNYWIVYFEAFTSGLMWSGAGIISMNFSLSVAPKNLRQLYAGFYGALGGLAMTVTMLLSGKFYPAPRELFGLALQSEQILFAITGAARLTAIIPLLFIKEANAQTLYYSVSQINHFAKVRILRFGQWFFERIKLYS